MEVNPELSFEMNLEVCRPPLLLGRFLKRKKRMTNSQGHPRESMLEALIEVASLPQLQVLDRRRSKDHLSAAGSFDKLVEKQDIFFFYTPKLEV